MTGYRSSQISILVRYLMVPLIVALTLACRMALNPWIGDSSPFLLFFAAIIVCSWLGGMGPGLVATILSWLAGDYFYLPPVRTIFTGDLSEAIQSITFLIPGVVVSLIVARVQHENRRARKAVAEAQANEAEARNSEERLRNAQQRALFFSTVLEDSEQPFAAGTPDGRLTFFNHAFMRLTGYSAEELHSITWSNDLTSPECHEHEAKVLEELNRTGQPQLYQKEYIRKDGTRVPLETKVHLVRDEHGQPDYYYSFLTDITERKRSEEALRKNEERFRALATASTYVVYRVSPDWGEMRELHGRDFIADTESPSATWLEKYVVPEDREHVMEVIHEAIRAKSVYELEHRVLRVDGSYGWILSRAIPLLDENGDITEWLGTAFDITDRKRAEEALRVANDRLLESDRRKDEFIAQLAHELRNPLAPIRYAVQVLNMNCPPDLLLQKHRDLIDRQISHMGRLLDDLLDVSRITRGKITLKRETVDLRLIARQALESLRPMIEARGQHLAYVESGTPLPVYGDPTRLEQIIRNLLHNAHKYSEAGGCIKLSVIEDAAGGTARQTTVCVSDSGIGIAPEILPHIFEAFVQAEQGLARSQGGLGIGLAMVKKLVEMHGGSSEAYSAGQGKGSEFVVRLPLVSDAMIVQASIPPAAARPAKSRRVLVVDDNEDSAASLGELLRLWGHEIQTVYDGRNALLAAHAWRPEIILLDIGLPGMDGYEVARRLREDSETAGAFLVALTGYGQDEDRRRSQEAGFNQHLTKPVEIDKLQNLLVEAEAA